MNGFVLVWVASLVLASSLQAQPLAADIEELVAGYFEKRPVTIAEDLSIAEALRVQEAFVRGLESKLGRRIGYKVGLVTKEARERFGVDAPVRGVLLETMLLPDRAEVPARYGARPLCEADLLVWVKDAGINKAKTPLEAARHLTEAGAFIELADLMVSPDQRLNGEGITAINVGARLGVVGDRIPVEATPEFVHALEEMEVRMVDGKGIELGRSTGAAIMGNPLNALVWLIADLQETGERLQAGDVVSLGSFAAIVPVPGQEVTVRYHGLPCGPLRVSVRFTDGGAP